MLRAVYKRLFFIFLLLHLCPEKSSHAGVPPAFADTTLVSGSWYSEESIRKYRSNPDFDYTSEKPEKEEGILRKFLRRLFLSLFDDPDPRHLKMLEKVLLWGTGAAGLVLLIWFLLRTERIPLQIFSRNKERKIAVYDFKGDEKELELLLENAEKTENYSLALRYLFIKMLFLLKNSGDIRWRPGKTNREYLDELTGEPVLVPFKRLVFLFEHVFYGQRAIRREDYEDALDQADQIQKQMKGGRHDPT